MTTKTALYQQLQVEQLTQVKCKKGYLFQSTVLPCNNIYACTKFNVNPFCTFKDMARTKKYYENKC